MNTIKRLLGFYSPYSWTKWLRISFAIVAVIIAQAFWRQFGFIVLGGGFFGAIISLFLFVLLFAPLLAAMLGAAMLIGLVIGGTHSGIKQRKSYRETAATGSAELMALERLRLKMLALNILFALTAIGLIALGFFAASPLYDAFGDAGIYGYAVLAILALVVFSVKKAPISARYKNVFKQQVVEKSLASMLDNMDFKPAETLDEDLVKNSALFIPHDIYNGNDYLAADYQGRHFIQSDIHLQQVREEHYRDDDGELRTRTVYTNIFSGRMMVFDYDAISNEPVAVLDRRGRKPKNEAIHAELDAFNQKFSIDASNPTAAFRILTPPVLEGIVAASNKLNHPLYLSFKDDKLFVALASGDGFEAAGGDATLVEQQKRVQDEIKTMLDLVTTLYFKK